MRFDLFFPLVISTCLFLFFLSLICTVTSFFSLEEGLLGSLYISVLYSLLLRRRYKLTHDYITPPLLFSCLEIIVIIYVRCLIDAATSSRARYISVQNQKTRLYSFFEVFLYHQATDAADAIVTLVVIFIKVTCSLPICILLAFALMCEDIIAREIVYEAK